MIAMAPLAVIGRMGQTHLTDHRSADVHGGPARARAALQTLPRRVDMAVDAPPGGGTPTKCFIRWFIACTASLEERPHRDLFSER